MAKLSRRTTIVLAGAIVVALIAALVVGVALAQRWVFSAAAKPPGVGTVVLAPSQSKAQRAIDAGGLDAADADTARYLAAQPTAYWLTPEQDPIGTAGKTVAALTAQARTQEVALALVVYGLPERDCGQHSAGGLSAADYPRWIDEIALALETAPDVQKIVVLEPDSLGLATECGNLDERAVQLRDAVHELTGPDTWIYLDGGHSSWHPAAEMAKLIERVDVAGSVRGFATNVSNYQSTFDEFAYAHELSELLGGMHAVIDTSRNGAATAGAQWCNPPGQRVGDAGGAFGDEVVDTNLWIKPPGESDGECHGGPAAGVWWPAGAAALTSGAR